MKFKNKFILFATLFVLIFTIGCVSATDLDDNVIDANDSYSLSVDQQESVLVDSEITVNDWDDLQYYCSQSDNNYVLKLKENTNYYPTNPKDQSYQIQINNNVTILGSSGAYIGDSSPNAKSISYLAINVPENSGIGITLKGVTFKWISTEYMPNGVFFQMGGNANNVFEDCYFTNSTLTGGHSSLVYLMRGTASLTNCTFTNITSDYGCLSVYDPEDNPTKTCTGASMEVVDSYFGGNYARSEPGCINNCGVLVVRNSTFYKNTAFWWAGAIHTHGGANTTIYDSNFTDNLAGWNGGALYTYSYLQIYNTIFSGNNCTTNNGGGAIGASKYLHAPYIYVKDSVFIDNENSCWGLDELSTTGTGRGGAISMMDEGNITVLNTTFIDNSASIGTAICAISQGSYGSPNVYISGNRFINHTKTGDVLVIKVEYNSKCVIEDNYYLANSIEFSKLKLTADDRIGDEVTLHIDASLKNPSFYDPDILTKSSYDVYMDGKYLKTVDALDFTLNLKNVEKAQVYVVPSISTSQSNEVSVGVPKEYIYVSQKSGKDTNVGSKESPVSTIAKAIELANTTGNIIIMDGTFSEKNLNVNYNLSIVGQSNVAFSAKGNVFTIGDVDVEFKNIIFKNSKQASASSERIIKHGKGILTIEDCTFESNSYVALIESDGSLEFDNLMFKDNTGILILANNYQISSSVFDNNAALTKNKASALIKSTSAFKCLITNSTFSNNNVLDGCIYFTASNSKMNTLTITESVFANNTGSEGSSGILMYNYGLLDIKSSLFLNNTDTGKSGALILTATETHISDSIFLQNTFENTNNAIFSSKTTLNLKKIYCSGNWFGNTADNYDTAPPVSSSSICDNWMFLNASANSTSIFQGENALVYFNLNNIYTKDGNVTYWDSGNLPQVKLTISANGGKSQKSEVYLVYGTAQTVYILLEYEGKLTASYYDVDATVNFTEAKIDPNMDVSYGDAIYVDDDEVIEVTLPDNATGSITLTIADAEFTKEITNPKTAFTVPNLSAGENKAVITYSGDDYYSFVKKGFIVNVNKYNSTTEIAVGDVNVGEDVVITVSVLPNVEGNVILTINGNETVLNLSNSKVTYTISSVTRGDYIIEATFTGNYKYLKSTGNAKFSVDKLDASINVSVEDIVYGNNAAVAITFNSTDLNGNVTVIVDGRNKSAEIKNGKANVEISDLTAGDKVVNVVFDGNNVYNPVNDSAAFKVSKADTALTINAANIKVGQEQLVEVAVSSGVDGNITLTCGENSVLKSIPRTGKVSWTLSGLDVGTYQISADLSSNNYNSVSDTVTFTVSDYENPIWPNEGYDVQNTGKSPFSTDSNGAVLWSFNLTDANMANIIIDSKGNLYLITSNGVISIDKSGKQLWKYESSNNGNFSGLVVGRDVIIAPEAGNTLHFINQTTGTRYGNSNVYQGSSLFAPVIDSNANVYITSEYQYASNDYKLVIVPYALWQKGGTPILISLGSSKPASSPVIVNDNIVVVACEDGLKIINIENKNVISSIKGNNNAVRPVSGSGNMIYAIFDDSIAGLTPQGSVVWQTKITAGAGSVLALDDEIGLYLLNSNGNLCKYDIVDGTESIVSNLTFTTGMLIDNDGNLYLGCDDVLYCFDNSGKIAWKADLEGSIEGSPVMGSDGIIYIAASNNIYALSKGKLIDNNLNVSVGDINAGEDAIVEISSDKLATGDLSVKVVGDSYTNVSVIGLAGGDCRMVFAGLDVGSYSVEVSYSGDLRYSPAVKSTQFNVNKLLDNNLSISARDIDVGEDAIIDIASDENATGNLTVRVVGDSYTNVSVIGLSGGDCRLVLDGLDVGSYNVEVSYSGDLRYNPAVKSSKFNVNMLKSSIVILTNQAYYSGQFVAQLLDSNSNPIGGEKVTVNINGTNYVKITDDGGRIYIGLTKRQGNYHASVQFNGNVNNSATKVSSNVNILSTIQSGDMSRGYNSGVDYEAYFLDNKGKPLANENVTFVVNGIEYNITTDNNGFAVLNKKLAVGTYEIEVINPVTGENANDKLNIVKRITNNAALTMDYLDGSSFKVRLIGDDGKAVGAGEIVKFKIGSKTYSAKTNANGYASIKITEVPKTYTVKTTYKGYTVSNKLVVKQVLKAKNISKKKAKSYKFSATLKTSKGKAITGKKIIFKIKGKKYTVKTNKKGVATITIKLNLKVGKYAITSTYSKTTIKNKITIKK